MKIFIIILALTIPAKSFASTFEIDTIDHWQIYHAGKLIIAGNAHMNGLQIKATLQKADLKDLKINYHHCSPKLPVSVTVQLINRDNKILLTKDFKLDYSDSLVVIHPEELRGIQESVLTIRYKENILNGIDLTLGQIEIQ